MQLRSSDVWGHQDLKATRSTDKRQVAITLQLTDREDDFMRRGSGPAYASSPGSKITVLGNSPASSA
jgi:hypothetical protein